MPITYIPKYIYFSQNSLNNNQKKKNNLTTTKPPQTINLSETNQLLLNYLGKKFYFLITLFNMYYLFIVQKIKQKYIDPDSLIKLWYINTTEYYASIKKNEKNLYAPSSVCINMECSPEYTVKWKKKEVQNNIYSMLPVVYEKRIHT